MKLTTDNGKIVGTSKSYIKNIRFFTKTFMGMIDFQIVFTLNITCSDKITL